MSLSNILAEVGAIPSAITIIEDGIPLIEKLVADADADAQAVWVQIKALIALFSPAPAVAAAAAAAAPATPAA